MSFHVLHVIRLPTPLVRLTSKHALASILISLSGIQPSSVVNAQFHPSLFKVLASPVMSLSLQKEPTQRKLENATVEFQQWFGMLLNLLVNVLAIILLPLQLNRLLAVMCAMQN